MRRALLALLLATATASANGRAPATNGVFFAPGDPHTIWVRTTFGPLVSHDDGCTFYWLCEQNIGYAGQFDPKYRIATDGTIFASTFSGLRVSHDGGCSFTTATDSLPVGDPGRIADIWIDALDIGPTGEIWAATAESGKPNDIYKSTDNGATFAPTGMQSPTVWWKSVTVAPDDAKTVYITGYQVAGTFDDGGQMPPTAHFVTTTDDGLHWTESALAGVAYGSTPLLYVTGVQPGTPTTTLVYSSGANPPGGDLLYRTTDGGVTFQQVLATTDPIRDVIYRDAMTVLVATVAGGSFTSADGGATFTPMAAPPQLACLGQQGGTVYGCGANWQPDFMAVGKSGDAASWSKVFRFVELQGPLACPAGTAEHDMCAPLWPSLQQQFGATGSLCNIAPGDAAPAPVVAKKTGCCDAGEGAPIGLAWAFGLGVWLMRRRRAGT
jgi:uncharacterized protein (TIGR03382 family)